RRVWILRRNTAHLLAYLDTLDAHLITEQEQSTNPSPSAVATIEEISKLLSKAREHVLSDAHDAFWQNLLSLDGVTHQLAAWRRAHDADRLITDLWSDDHVAAHALVAKEELKSLGNQTASTLAEKIAYVIETNTVTQLRFLLKEARCLIFSARDTYYEELSDWQHKALWLVIITGAIVVLLATSQSNVLFLLLGAVGGLLARLAKAIKAKDVGFDYGVSWSILFLAPLVGALMGWAGVLLSDFILALDILKLPEKLLIKMTTEKDDMLALTTNTKNVMAILFGFSATLFEGVMSGAISALTKKPSGSGK
ncbi:MAG: hypothetical protein P8104_11040, partial [Gammaproteobacteria bacterium]